MNRAIPICKLLVLSAVLSGGLASLTRAADKEEITVYRDEFGTPHVYASTAEGACYAHGYAQAEDRLEELLKQYMRCTGTMSEAFGPEFLRDDYRQRLYRHATIAKEKYSTLTAKSRALIEAYQAGVKAYMKEHASEVPAWAPNIEPWMCVALSRYIIWGWPEGEAGGDLKRIGVEPDPVEYHGSNEWLVAPRRTAYNAPIALIDPHLSWYGQFRFYEVRLYGGEIEFSGMCILGNPLPAMGHNRYCSIAMTTGGPDTSDVYEEEINPDNPRQYRYDGQWLDMTVRPETIKVKGENGVGEKKVELEYTRHGPVVARKNGKAYTFCIPYFDEVGLADQTYQMITAKNLNEMKKALSMLQLMMQNLMIGTVDGDIYYVRNGRVPIRPAGYDYKRAMPGNTSKAEWQGIHKFEDLVQIENPPQGYMQNCNVSPQFLMRDCPLKASAERPYLFNGFNGFDKLDQAYDNPLHQRAKTCVDLLHASDNMTVDDAFAVAMSPIVSGIEPWQQRLHKAWDSANESASGEARGKQEVAACYKAIINWNRRCDADSVGAVAYKYWKEAFGKDVERMDRAGLPPTPDITDEQMIATLAKAAAKLQSDFGRADIAYGEVYRVGRKGTDKTWPVSGGSVSSIATPRAISFEPIPDTKKFLGHGGQTSTQVVLLTKPPKSWTLLPLGESDHADGRHYDDQCEKLFSPSKMKPTYFLDRDELAKHAESKKVLTREVN
jgi:acyl-homoserine-lactone acylase